MRERKSTAKVVFLCTAWYAISSSQNVINKRLLNSYPLPTTLSLSHMLSIVLYLPFVITAWGVPSQPVFSPSYYLKVLVPLSLGKFLASVTAHVSIWKVPVSYAHTVKALLPLFTVSLTRCIMKEKHPLKIYLTLVPIVSGVVLATVTELSFNLGGMVSALFSTMFISLQTIFSKKALEDTGIHEFRLLLIMTQLTLLSLIPVWIFMDSSKFLAVVWNTEGFIDWNLLLMIISSGFLNFSQNVVAFSMLSTVSSVSYSVANSMKRIVVIGVSLAMLHNPVTSMNVIGMSVAVTGVLIYNRVKSDTSRQKHELPVYSSDVDGSVPNGKLLGVWH